MNNDDKLREQLKSEPVPDRLRPENIKIMLDNEAPKKKRSGISVANRVAAAAAACAVIGGTAVYTLNNGKFNKNTPSNLTDEGSKPDGNSNIRKPTEANGKTSQLKYMSSAKDYEQVYTMFRKSSKKAEKRRFKYDDFAIMEEADEVKVESGLDDFTATNATGAKGVSDTDVGGAAEPETPIIDGELPTEPDPEPATEVTTEPVTEDNTEPTTEAPTEEPTEEPTTEASPDHSETYYQEQDVLEADIVKTDGERIYYVTNYYSDNGSNPALRVMNVKDGKFTGDAYVDIRDEVNRRDNTDNNLTVTDMYVYNDMIALIGSESNYSAEGYISETYVAFYTTGDSPELIDVYKQDGYYNDIRISPEGYMLLSTSYTTGYFDELEGSSDIRRYIPCYGFTDSFDCLPAEDIFVPDDGFQANSWLSYSIIGSIDLNESGAPKACDIKSLAGYSGSIYCSADNLYMTSWGENNTTSITRIAINGGELTPAADCVINGYIKDQFSMSEYEGYFRVAATYTEEKETFHSYDENERVYKRAWNRLVGEGDEGYYTYEFIKKDSRVYVLDMDMNMVGYVDGLGIDEDIKSASFSGNMAYVVTFRQTDPLYAVDLSDPTKPVVLSELKINGFSTYMQSWGDGLLLGFGQDADDDGRIKGLRLTMFDNSDPNNVKPVDVFTWNNTIPDWEDISGQTEEYYGSTALWDRKALLIAPEKNLIGVPININKYRYSDNYGYDNKYDYSYTSTSEYVFFSFEDGKFVQKGDISEMTSRSTYDSYYELAANFDRALYIGDYVYTLSSKKAVAADINTLEITDELVF